MNLDFSTISRQIETLSKVSPEAIQDVLSPNDARELRRNLNKLSVALESPGDIVDRIVYAVRPLAHDHALGLKNQFHLFSRY